MFKSTQGYYFIINTIMFKEYGKDTQKGKIIQILMKNPTRFHQVEDFMQYYLNELFVGYEAGSRLSELKKAGVVEHSSIERKDKPDKFGYKIKDTAIKFYETLYAEEKKHFMEKIGFSKKSA